MVKEGKLEGLYLKYPAALSSDQGLCTLECMQPLLHYINRHLLETRYTGAKGN